MKSQAERNTDEKGRNQVYESETVLITGGSGLIGRYLTSALLEKGHKVSHLSRREGSFGKVRVYRWDPENKVIDPALLGEIDYIVHLAGENIGDSAWSGSKQERITRSRVESTMLLHRMMIERDIRIRAFISASAVGYYGSVTTDKFFTEEDPPAEDFLGNVCRSWEMAADLFADQGIRTVKIRTASVLAGNGGILPKLKSLSFLGFIPVAGNGFQYFPWIHIRDLCNIYIKALVDNKMSGSFNAAAPQHITLQEMMKALSKATQRPFIPFHVPGIIMRSIIGKRSELILYGSRISSSRLEDAGFRFAFPDISDALKEIIINSKQS